jgi:hypothetical protein
MRVIDNQQVAYLRRRIIQEHDLSEAASCDEARAAHAKMASIYTTRLTLNYLDQVNTYRDLQLNILND